MKRNRWIMGWLAAAAGLYLLRQWGTRWGATRAETCQSLPGDGAIPRPHLQLTNAISIQAPAGKIWPWLVQMGYYRGGWFTDSTWRDWDYYPDRILRYFVREEASQSGYFHRDTPTHSQVIPELQNLKAGDMVLDGPPGTAFFTVAAIEPNQHLILHSDTHLRFLFPKSIRENARLGIGGEFTWGFFLREAGKNQSRLIMRTRGRIHPGWYRALASLTLPIANLLLARKMLTGIKTRAEQF